MADIAFLLLIFFIATTIFDVEQGITLLLPGVGGKTTKVNPKNVMRITTDETGGIFVDGDPVRAEEIEGMTRQRIAENDWRRAGLLLAREAPMPAVSVSGSY